MANNYYNFPTPFVPGTKVRSEQVNTQYQGLESAFDLLPTDPAANIIGTAWFGTDAQGATVNDYLITTPDPQSALVNGQRVSFFATHSNSGAATINVDSLGVVNFVENDGVALAGGEIVSGLYYEGVYDNANTQFLRSLAASASASGPVGTFTSSDAIDLTDASVAIRIGAVDPTAAQHIEIDPQSIQSKSNGTTPAAININALGGDALIGNDGTTPDGSTISLLYDGTVMLQSDAAGLLVSQDAVFSQQADHSFTPGAGIGSLWHRTVDGKIIWTDPSGTDFDLTTGAVAAGLTTEIQFNNAGAFAGDANLTWDGTTFTCTGFVSTGIDDNATAERMQIADTLLTIGSSGGGDYTVGHAATNGSLIVAGGNGGTDGGNFRIFGSTHSTNAGDINVRSGSNSLMVWDESVGRLEILTGTGPKTLAATFNADQSVDFAGNISSLGIDDNATGERLQLSDSDVALGDMSSAEIFGIGLNTTTDGTLWLSGQGQSTGGNIRLNGASHASQPGDVLIRSGTNVLMVWDESVGDLAISTGIGAKTLAATFNADQSVDFAGNISSLGFDDNATAERLQLSDTLAAFGASGSTYTLHHAVDDQLMVYSGGSSATGGASIVMDGGSHASTGDMRFRNDANTWMLWDESVGDLEILTGIGAKTSALVIDASQVVNLPVGQLAFPSTQNASTDPNILDDYEEGNHTVTITLGTSGTVTMNTSFDQLHYTKVGGICHVSGNIRISSVSSPVGQVRISIPFAQANLADFDNSPASIWSQGHSGTIQSLVTQTVEGNTYFVVLDLSTAGVATDIDGNLQAGMDFFISLVYKTDFFI